jgi:hypothetical protein
VPLYKVAYDLMTKDLGMRMLRIKKKVVHLA